MAQNVSIHAPREGCDSEEHNQAIQTYRFNSRTPGGVRRVNTLVATASLVSIHAPREGCDIYYLIYFATKISFNSRTPGGVRLRCKVPIVGDCEFQFTHPGRGATRMRLRRKCGIGSFNSRTPGGVRLALFSERSSYDLSFNSRTPGGVRRHSSYYI